jgi:hypothetical protein
MAGKIGLGATRIAALATIAIVLTVGYAFLAGIGSITPGQSSQGIIGSQGSQPGLISASTVTETTTAFQQLTTTLTFSFTETNSQTTQTMVQTTTLTYTSTETTTSTCAVGRCILLVATTPTNVDKKGSVSFLATDPIPQERSDPFTVFMDCGCAGGVYHGYFSNGVANFTFTFYGAGVHSIWIADGDQSTNATTRVFSNSVYETVSST